MIRLMVKMARADIFTPIHKGLRSMIYELGKELQTTDFTDEQATAAMVSRLKQDLSLTSSTCIWRRIQRWSIFWGGTWVRA